MMIVTGQMAQIIVDRLNDVQPVDPMVAVAIVAEVLPYVAYEAIDIIPDAGYLFFNVPALNEVAIMNDVIGWTISVDGAVYASRGD